MLIIRYIFFVKKNATPENKCRMKIRNGCYLFPYLLVNAL